MTPLLVATNGFIPCGSPQKIAAKGFIGVCTQVLSIGGPDAEDEKPRLDDNQIILMVIKEFMSKQ